VMCCAGAYTNVFRYDTSRITGQLQTMCASAARIYRRRQHHILVLRHEILQSHERIRTLASKSCTWLSLKHFLHRIQVETAPAMRMSTPPAHPSPLPPLDPLPLPPPLSLPPPSPLLAALLPLPARHAASAGASTSSATSPRWVPRVRAAAVPVTVL
jgi:hypothetical protein